MYSLYVATNGVIMFEKETLDDPCIPYFYATILVHTICTYVLPRAPETRYYWITFLIRPLYRQHSHPLSLSSRPPSNPPCPTSYVATTPRRILHFRIPNGITMQEISFVIYARYKRVHFRLG